MSVNINKPVEYYLTFHNTIAIASVISQKSSDISFRHSSEEVDVIIDVWHIINIGS